MKNVEDKIKEIQDKFDKILYYSQVGLDDPQTDEIFERWYKAKKRFLKNFNFNEDFIYEYPEEVSFEFDDEYKFHKIDTLIDDLYFCADYTCSTWKYLYDFILSNKEDFYNNRLKKDYIIPDTDIVIKTGTKIIKAFKYFFNDKEKLNEAQSKASLLIQENKLKGKLCISINPIDFLSASENTYNWRSCHALDGEYRAGNISYMLDSTTVMCYIKGEEDKILPNFPSDVKWNSKKWRMWLFLSDNNNMLFAGRQYPFHMDTIIDFIKNNMLNKIGNFELPWMKNYLNEYTLLEENGRKKNIHYEDLVPLNNGFQPIRELVKDKDGSLHYNDLLYSNYYTPLYTFNIEYADGMFFYRAPEDRIKMETDGKPHFILGDSFKCLRCGRDNVTLNETLLCTPCELAYGAADGDNFRTCDWCGERYLDEEGYYVSGEDADVCPYCWENHTFTCEYCGEGYYEHHIYYDEKREGYYCEYCLERLKENE